MTSSSAISPSRHQVVVTSPGDVSPSALRAVAEGLARLVAEVAEAIFRAPTVLVDDLDADTATALDRLLASLGLESRVAPHGEAPAEATPLDVAIQVQDVARVAAVTESLADFLGVSAQRAFGLLATRGRSICISPRMPAFRPGFRPACVRSSRRSVQDGSRLV
ncbi:hypothetical protein FEI13_14100 [Halomonas urmiana]|uniref:Uncharacterized protein n=1 Tax=Halomonas urmiana TaxID=490901 RepID=A0A5R8MDV1_9GAMM|nr:hypothetical protein [Halomonas urmiana]TLF47883.1 hypothetical protein FEI13_14100 [Halomonas urmiana]